MRKILFAGGFALAVSLCASLASAEVIDPAIREDLAKAIRAKGYICRTCEGGRQWAEPTGRTLLQVFCNGNSLSYRVIVSPSEKVSCIEPWDDEGKKCK